MFRLTIFPARTRGVTSCRSQVGDRDGETDPPHPIEKLSEAAVAPDAGVARGAADD